MNYTALNNTIDTDNECDDVYSDSPVEPLLASSTTAADIGVARDGSTSSTAGNNVDDYMVNSGHDGSAMNLISGGRPRHQNQRFGILSNRRDNRKTHTERWGRIRLGIFSMCFVFFIYICFNMGIWMDQRPPIIVNVPPMDDSLPGPKGTDMNAVQFVNITTTTTSIPYNKTVPPGYLVWSPGCQMPALDPLASDVMKLFTQEKYEPCSSTKPLTTINYNWTTYTAELVLNLELKAKSYAKTTCCYQEIHRAGEGKQADEKFNLTDCVTFKRTIELPSSIEYILVKCKGSNGKAQYNNAHAIMRERTEIRQKLDKATQTHNRTRPLSVLMLSIDSISRLNLIRAMPRTAQHLYDSGWFELQGYNKIDDNTYPNLMAILVGYNNTLAYNVCEPRNLGKLEQCPFVWKDFRDNGYVTAYGEDETSISSFNYHKMGFTVPPTDYYQRPYMMAAEKNLKIKRKHSLTFCLGYNHSVDHIYQYALDFATMYKNDPSFGIFWSNTFSHNDVSDPSSMDSKINGYLFELEKRGILNNSMVIFFSDHGIRFGPVRHLVTGWLEERLPFIFIWLPKWFRLEHPEIVEALKINRNRLTNPYDLHMTLKHVIELSGRGESLPQATSCSTCQSLFKEMPWNRSCEETSIASHWCTCAPYKANNKDDKIVRQAANYIIGEINSDLRNHTDEHGQPLCAELKLKKVSYAQKAEYHDRHDPYDDYMCVFEAVPSGAWFESTVRYKRKKKTFEISGSLVHASTSIRIRILAAEHSLIIFEFTSGFS